MILANDQFCARVKVPSAAVVAKALPGVQDVAFGSGGQGREVREPSRPSIIIRSDRADLGLLKHHFRNENCVRIPGLAPREIATMFAVPREDGGTKTSLLLTSVQESERLTPNAERPISNAEN